MINQTPCKEKYWKPNLEIWSAVFGSDKMPWNFKDWEIIQKATPLRFA